MIIINLLILLFVMTYASARGSVSGGKSDPVEWLQRRRIQQWYCNYTNAYNTIKADLPIYPVSM